MFASDPKVEVNLPFGLPDGRGRRARAAALVCINGRGEMLGAEDPNPFRAVLRLLAASTWQVGPFHGDEIDIGVLSGLIPLDRDFLLLHLSRLTFGDVRFQTVVCPVADCGRRLDIRFDLSEVTVPAVPSDAGGRMALPDGRKVCFRLPTAGDQVALHGLRDGALEAAFLERCVRADPKDPGSLEPASVLALPDELRTEVVRRIVAASPEFDLSLELECVECGRHFRFAYDPVLSLLDELRASRLALLKEVHALAFHYHWSQAEILSLSRNLRREYLALLDEEINGQGQGALR